MRYVAVCVSILILAVTSGCGAKPPETIGLDLAPYAITNVSVVESSKITYGSPTADGSSQAVAAKRVVSALKQSMTSNLVEATNGRKPATLKVTLTKIDMTSQVGQALLKSKSSIVGDVVLVDAKTGITVGQREGIVATDHKTGFRFNVGSIPVGSLVDLAVTSAETAEKKRTSHVVESFVGQTRNWIGR